MNSETAKAVNPGDMKFMIPKMSPFLISESGGLRERIGAKFSNDADPNLGSELTSKRIVVFFESPVENADKSVKFGFSGKVIYSGPTTPANAQIRVVCGDLNYEAELDFSVEKRLSEMSSFKAAFAFKEVTANFNSSMELHISDHPIPALVFEPDIIPDGPKSLKVANVDSLRLDFEEQPSRRNPEDDEKMIPKREKRRSLKELFGGLKDMKVLDKIMRRSSPHSPQSGDVSNRGRRMSCGIEASPGRWQKEPASMEF